MGNECTCIRSENDQEINIGHGVYSFKKAVFFINKFIFVLNLLNRFHHNLTKI